MMDSLAFRTAYNGIAGQLRNEVGITPHAIKDGSIAPEGWAALWDTGATNTVISKRIVARYNLIPVSYRRVSTSQGGYDAACYYVDMFLPNRVHVPKIRVIEGELSGFDILIGMDIIVKGISLSLTITAKRCFLLGYPVLHT